MSYACPPVTHLGRWSSLGTAMGRFRSLILRRPSSTATSTAWMPKMQFLKIEVNILSILRYDFNSVSHALVFVILLLIFSWIRFLTPGYASQIPGPLHDYALRHVMSATWVATQNPTEKLQLLAPFSSIFSSKPALTSHAPPAHHQDTQPPWKKCQLSPIRWQAPLDACSWGSGNPSWSHVDQKKGINELVT